MQMKYKIRIWDRDDLNNPAMEIVSADADEFDPAMTIAELIEAYLRWLYCKHRDLKRMYKTHPTEPENANDVHWWWFADEKPELPSIPFEPLPFDMYVNESSV